MLRSCFNPKVLVALGLVGAGVLVLEPGLFAAALPVLLLAACPLSMLLMGRMGMSHRSSVTNAASSYTCPMHPDVQSDKPGRCPTCGMTLVTGATPETHIEGGKPTVEELQVRLQTVTEQRAALARELEKLRSNGPEAGRTVLEEAESIARAAAERQ